MGNVNSSSSVHSVPTTQCHHHKTRSLRSTTTTTRKGLKKFGSSATLAKLYHHHNISAATMPSKAIAWKNQHGERILDIGKPTKFEHGIHVEFDDDSGKYMGLPDVWQSNFPSDDILDTAFIHPILVPTCESPSSISHPFNIKHHIHVELDQDGIGFKGLPQEWKDKVAIEKRRTMKIVESPDSLFHSDSDLRSKRELHLSTSRNSVLKANVLKAVKVIQDQENVENTCLNTTSCSIDDIADNPTTNPNTIYNSFVLIAEGESGPLYAAKHIGTNKVVAIKKIHKTASVKISKIRNELITMKMSRHPNVVEYITSYVTNDEIWVVMEFMEMALSDILSLESTEEGLCISIDESLIARVARDILRALTRIHRLNRIHRDIRSDNILINLRGDVKLTDFSQCAQLTKAQPKRNSIVGTPYWMAPELIKGKEYDTKIDIWSLGVLIYEMAQNNPPYIEHPPLKALYLIASNGLPPLENQDRWSDNFKDFLSLCTTMDPINRPDTSVLLKHPFITTSVGTAEDMIALLEKARQIETLQQLAQDEDIIEKDLAI
ncbi:hypothetical protein INT48_004270 [Thamnidium elegans]|uniref:Non-specific serine/threonine protein kinase n=1 Tax=Thamnidium elegans TaxID=101142 RepID=A0A8H7VWM0_9FUNG|nr:hypothetical protein INT48_004270 [Thamnidium elegans]